MQKSRWLLQTLILSVALNAALLCTFFYFLIRDNPLHFSYRPQEELHHEPPPITSSLLGRLHLFSFEQLTALLNDDRKVEQGYKVKDFALGALASFYDLDVERGIGKRIAKRKWEWEGQTFLLFPGLKDQDFEALEAYVQKEKWPLTPKGLFKIICREGIEKSDPELLNLFCHTPHFILLETLFARTELPIRKKTILSLALESGWENLEQYHEKQQKRVDFSTQMRRLFLLDAIQSHSPIAAQLLLMTDGDFAVKHLEDEQILKMLDLITLNTHASLKFIQSVAVSPRADGVLQKARSKLSEFTGVAESDLAGHFVEKPGLKNLRPEFRQQPPAAPDPRTHIIKPGETLWQIARQYGVPMDLIMEINHLPSTTIQPGKVLKIP